MYGFYTHLVYVGRWISQLRGQIVAVISDRAYIPMLCCVCCNTEPKAIRSLDSVRFSDCEYPSPKYDASATAFGRTFDISVKMFTAFWLVNCTSFVFFFLFGLMPHFSFTHCTFNTWSKAQWKNHTKWFLTNPVHLDEKSTNISDIQAAFNFYWMNLIQFKLEFRISTIIENARNH